jgi:hypothetical protein
MFRRFARVSFALICLGASAQACHLRAPDYPIEYSATVIGRSSPEETARQTGIGMQSTGGMVAPRFMSLPRILADFTDAAGIKHRIISAVTDGDIPAPGSTVVLRSRYIDPDNDYQYIPWTVKPNGPVS